MLCAGKPSEVVLVAAFALTLSETSAFSTGEFRFARALSGSSSSKSSGAKPVINTLLTWNVFCGMHDSCKLDCDSFARKRFRGMRGEVRKGGASRTALASELCARTNWRNARGEPCISPARKTLPRLASQLGLRLPAPAPLRNALPSHPDLYVETTLADMGTVSLEPLEGREGSRSSRSMMASHHPEGVPRHPGKALNYLVISSRLGCLGKIGFCAASWHQEARDRYIGWSERARCAGLGRMEMRNWPMISASTMW